MTAKRWLLGYCAMAVCGLGSSNTWADNTHDNDNDHDTGWASAGRDLKNSRYQSDEHKISPKTVAGLRLRWTITTSGDVTANPAIDGPYLYFPDSAGFLYKVHRKTGALVWKRRIETTPALPATLPGPQRRWPASC